jgi:predicted transcriptional regulator
MAQHIVTGPLVITKKEDGSDLYLYENSVLPDFVSADEVKRLVSLGLVDKVSAAEAKKTDAPSAESN